MEGKHRQETIGTWGVGAYFGDGSATSQQDRDRRRATAALWQPTADNQRGDTEGHYTRRAVTGWFPTSARGELLAAIDFLDRAPISSTFIGDCKYILDILNSNVPYKYRSSYSVDADLWRIAKRAMDAKCGRFTFIKTKAHRSRQAAEDEGPESLKEWEGNKMADELARGLCQTIQRQVDTSGENYREQYGNLLQRMAVGAGWSLRHWPEVAAIKKPRGTRGVSEAQASNGTVGPHPVRPRHEGGLECTRCRLRAATLASIKSLRIKPCLGPTMDQCHKSHQMRWSSGVAWCCVCGKYTSRIPNTLREACPRRPQSEAARNILARLRRGLPPTTAAYLKRVREEADAQAELEAIACIPRAADHGVDHSHSREANPEVRHIAADADIAHVPSAADSHVAIHSINDSYINHADASAPAAAAEAQIGGDINGGSSSSARAPAPSATSTGAPRTEPTSRLTSLDLKEGLRPRPRRRIVGKQRPPGETTSSSAPTSSALVCRQPNRIAAWSRRIGFAKLPYPSSCSACPCSTRTTCSSCHLPLCLLCAKARRPCQSTE